MEICTRVYRPRRPRESPLFRLVERHIEEFLRVYPERFAKQHGPLRPVVERVLRGFVKCGDVAHGFARAWCETCRLERIPWPGRPLSGNPSRSDVGPMGKALEFEPRIPIGLLSKTDRPTYEDTEPVFQNGPLVDQPLGLPRATLEEILAETI